MWARNISRTFQNNPVNNTHGCWQTPRIDHDSRGANGWKCQPEKSTSKQIFNKINRDFSYRIWCCDQVDKSISVCLWILKWPLNSVFLMGFNWAKLNRNCATIGHSSFVTYNPHWFHQEFGEIVAQKKERLTFWKRRLCARQYTCGQNCQKSKRKSLVLCLDCGLTRRPLLRTHTVQLWIKWSRFGSSRISSSVQRDLVLCCCAGKQHSSRDSRVHTLWPGKPCVFWSPPLLTQRVEGGACVNKLACPMLAAPYGEVWL